MPKRFVKKGDMDSLGVYGLSVNFIRSNVQNLVDFFDDLTTHEKTTQRNVEFIDSHSTCRNEILKR